MPWDIIATVLFFGFGGWKGTAIGNWFSRERGMKDHQNGWLK